MKYRIVTDKYAGYEVQEKSWYWPFWTQTGFSNTHSSMDQAKRYMNCVIKNRTFKAKQVYP